MGKSTRVNSAKSERPPIVDTAIWLLITVVFLGGLAANYFYFSGVSVYIRIAGWIVLAIILIGLALLTKKGKAVFAFSKDARAELRKVHWPSRQETIQTTLMVIVMVVIVGIILWGMDSLFMWAVNWLTGQRG